MKQKLLFLLKCNIVILIIISFYCIFSAYLDNRISELYNEHKIYVNHINGLPIKDKGNSIIKNSLDGNNILVMGSSELSSAVPENPKNLFPNNLYDGDITMVGHASVQNALHAINIGANGNNIQGNNIMIVESLQWFMGDDIDYQGFFANFSELQFYEFLHNDKISIDNKKYLCNRYIELENANAKEVNSSLLDKLPYNFVEGNITNKQTYLLARLYSSENFLEKVLYHLTRPYYYLRYKILELKDKYDTYTWLKTLPTSDRNVEKVNIDWNSIYNKAEEEGKNSCTNNDLYVNDEYYTTYLEYRYDDLKDYNKDTSLLTSKEWEDYQFFLSVCKDLDIKPYIIIMSTNGLYYDYVGMDQNKRADFYNKVENLARNNQFEVLNLKDYEYSPYFYCDVMHLGWKGWPYVIQESLEHFKK